MNNIMQFALNMLATNPNVANSGPLAQAGIAAIRNGDSKAGEEIAMNICNTMGCSKEEAITRAKQFFKL